jgi:hypothetical protein
MTQQTTADPWGGTGQSTQIVAIGTDPDPQGKVVFECPHCGAVLTPHHDTVGSLHCNSTECNACCFLPPDETSNGQPRGKFEARPCLAARKVSGF